MDPWKIIFRPISRCNWQYSDRKSFTAVPKEQMKTYITYTLRSNPNLLDIRVSTSGYL